MRSQLIPSPRPPIPNPLALQTTASVAKAGDRESGYTGVCVSAGVLGSVQKGSKQNHVLSRRKNYQRREAGRCHSGTKNVFMIPKEKGKEGISFPPLHPRPCPACPGQVTRYPLAEATVEKANLGKDSSTSDGLQNHFHLRDSS